MEENELMNLREWAPLDDLLTKLPTKIQRGLFFQDLSLTCVDVTKEFMALGTNAGIVFWYNRKTGELQRLRSEHYSPITRVKIVSSVEYLVAAGSASGQVNVFQIQKPHPPDLNLEPLTRKKPIERYTIRDLHHTPVRCVEWSKNGMKLFSGDKQGVIVLTEFDFQTHISKSTEIINEAYDIVQMTFRQPWLLVSTVYRTIICEKETNGKWKVSQVGKKDRKVLSSAGATFNGYSRHPVGISVRPGCRLWLSDTTGNVTQTLLFKEAISRCRSDVPILNPGRPRFNSENTNFGCTIPYGSNHIVTYDEHVIWVLNMTKTSVDACVRNLRAVLDLAVCNDELFVLEGSRSLVRIATQPDQSASFVVQNTIQTPASIVADPTNLFVESIASLDQDIEAIMNGEECFELPPIEHIELVVPLVHSPDSELLVEHTRKLKILDRINVQNYADDSILFKSGVLKKSQLTGRRSEKKKDHKKKTGIVEIGQMAARNSETTKTTHASLLEASFCEGGSVVPDLRSPDTITRELEPKERDLAEHLQIKSVELEILPPASETETVSAVGERPRWKFPLPLPPEDFEINFNTPAMRQIHFVADDIDGIPQKKQTKNNPMSHSETTPNKNSRTASKCTRSDEYLNAPICKLPDYMNIPNLWNIRIQNDETVAVPTGNDEPSATTCCPDDDWELVDI